MLASALPLPSLGLARLHDALVWLGEHPLATAAIAGLSAHAIAMPMLRGELQRWRQGVWAALPIPEARVVVSAALLASVVAVAAALALWSAVALSARLAGVQAVDFPSVLAGCAGVAALAGVQGLTRESARLARITLRRALWSLRGLEDRGLPHLTDWQRRVTLQQWRGRTAAPVIGGMLLATPSSAELASLVVIAMVALLAWLVVAMRASMRVHRDARLLLRAQPLAATRITVAAMRYPAFAMASVALVAGLLALAGRMA